LGESLVREPANYISRATASVPSQIRNLVDVNRMVNVAQLRSAVGYEYLRTAATTLEDGGSTQTMKQRGFQLINPTEKWFPGIEELRSNYSSWDWVIGKTPKFTVQKDLEVKGDEQDMKLKLSVEVEAVRSSYYYLIFPLTIVHLVGINEGDRHPAAAERSARSGGHSAPGKALQRGELERHPGRPEARQRIECEAGNKRVSMIPVVLARKKTKKKYYPFCSFTKVLI